MSASSVRRHKDLPTDNRKPAKTLTPVSNPTLKKSSSGKENPRPSSLSRASMVTHKPMIRPLPRIEKAAALGGSDSEGRVRWSTSSAPRGRSQSPSEFIRVFSDLKKDGISMDRENKGFKDLRVKGSRESGGFKENLVMKVKENERKINGVRVLDGNCKEDVKFSSDLGRSNGDDIQKGAFRTSNVKGISDFGSERGACVTVDEKCDAKFLKEKSLSDGKSLEVSKEKGSTVQESGGSGVGVKYSTKLHEKLAYLEGKVKRIASDIKKTKEMLDMNNPDASKVILSDIQDKISGIEEAMSHVVSDSNGKTSAPKGSEDEDVSKKGIERSQSKEEGSVKISVKELKSEELEARLFPHHKLLRNRTSLKESSGSSQSQEPSNSINSTSELREENKSLSPIKGNLIASEFLASLDKEQTKVTERHEQDGLENSCTQEMDGDGASGAQQPLKKIGVNHGLEFNLESDERFEDFGDQDNRPTAVIGEETEDASFYQLNEIGRKTSIGGWFVSEGEAVLAHDDGSCSFYDIVNCEEKAVYKPPAGVSPNIWRDCWIIRAPSADGCSGRYVLAASAGNSLESGFCSWDFYTKDVRAFHIECGETAPRTVLSPLQNNTLYRRNALCNSLSPETQQWWYKPCGPLIISTASSQKAVKVYDIRDGEEIMKWEVQKPVSTMDYSSPLQWRNRGKVVVAEAEMISVWDVNSLHPQTLLSVSSSGRKISALHVNNTDAEFGGGVRQRVSSSEAEGNDGVFCTPDSINILDFRHPSGIGAKIAKVGVSVQSVFARGDSIFLGCTNLRSSGKKQQPCSQVQQFSLRKQRLFSTYSLPESNAHSHYSTITQVWGNSNLVMGVCGQGLFVFDALKDDGLQPFIYDYGSAQNVREIVGPDDLYSPSFDYLASRVLLISRDRPALWRHLS